MSKQTPVYFEVAVAAPIHQTLTYAPPAGVAQLPPGHRLLVPLGRRQVTGYLLDCAAQPPALKDGGNDRQPGGKIRAALEVLDDEPLFPAAMVPFFRWIADYYHHPIGEVIQNALPAGLSRRSTRIIKLTDRGAEKLPSLAQSTASKRNSPLPLSDWLPELLARGELSATKSATVIRRRPPELKRWQDEGLIEIDNRLRRESVRAQTETIIFLPALPPAKLPPDAAANIKKHTTKKGSDPFSSSVALKPSEDKTLALLTELAANNPNGVPRRELLKRYPGAGRALKGLLARNQISTFEQRRYRDPFGEAPPFFPRPERLTDEQSAVMARLTPAIEGRQYTPFLLHGITGSGKTEIYLRAAEAALAAGRQVLVLVPEIALATQLEGHFCSRFGNAVALLHSGLSGGQRYDQWSLLLSGEAQIAIGARSAIFAPLADPGLIIVDEEHDPAYKQEDGLRYNARDLALLRGVKQQATVLLGSATPAVSSYHAARQGKFELLQMTRRVEDRPLPAVEIVDLKAVRTVSGLPPLFSPQLIRALRENLAAGQQSLVFLNRRGFANLVLCKDCGRPVQCRHCQVTLTYHKKADLLLCHHCGYRQPRASLCGHCHSGTLVPAGFGTERLEEELRRHFPAARLARLDQDTSRDRKEFLKVLKAVRDHEVDILIGTQMITKGHHFPRVTLVGIVWADAGLGIPDYKAAERTFQLLTQVTGRAGRGEQPGRVLVQTLQSEHYSIALARAHDYQGLYEQEIALRQRLGFPPWGRLINLRFDGEKEEKVRELALRLGEIARGRADSGIKVLGPAPAPLSRLKDRFRWQLLLKGRGVAPLHRLCQALLGEYARLAGASTVKLSLDVDPENML
ncbi:replication restart helicase PriA [Desulfurivibrio alkaliphilus]|uniref:Replication restart protein PriA n=1 Tax=Desulfurivibrio alkaliphilus (strain DSM 19089 / UNIQEM U267 / AHT2) TaxID=589865 RepID=D6YZR5_DESAT|nr:primosomal protein N' [Desulfurivibrio alkaliphilus]ADH85072.1 primosomal protein N' [Desulfurivibrio alkaliphilus AHT 2]